MEVFNYLLNILYFIYSQSVSYKCSQHYFQCTFILESHLNFWYCKISLYLYFCISYSVFLVLFTIVYQSMVLTLFFVNKWTKKSNSYPKIENPDVTSHDSAAFTIFTIFTALLLTFTSSVCLKRNFVSSIDWCFHSIHGIRHVLVYGSTCKVLFVKFLNEFYHGFKNLA